MLKLPIQGFDSHFHAHEVNFDYSIIDQIGYYINELDCPYPTTAKTLGLGISACWYYGFVDDKNLCPPGPMNLSDLPIQCTSLVFDGLNVAPDLVVNLRDAGDEKTIEDLVNTNKPVYVVFGHQNVSDWINAVQKDNCTGKNANTEKKNTQNTIKSTKITGLILKGLNFVVDMKYDSAMPCNFYANLKSYIQVYKNGTNWQVGLYVNANSLMHCVNTNNFLSYCFNYTVLNQIIDFYVIGFEHLNVCDEYMLQDGICPFDSVDKKRNTLKKFADALKCSDIIKKDIYFEFDINPIIQDLTDDVAKCFLTYSKMCEDTNYKYYWCAENTTSYNVKGKFAKDQGAKGFIGKHIDRIDPTDKCKCNNKFITFSCILDGFQGKKSTSCADLDNFPNYWG